MDKLYICSKCKKEYSSERIYYVDDKYICDTCLQEYEDKFHQTFNIWLTSQDKYDVSISITDFIKLVDAIKFNFNTLTFNIPLNGLNRMFKG